MFFRAAPSPTPLLASLCVAWCVWATACVVVSADGRKSSASIIVQALAPSGIRISVPDSPGVDVVVINANINTPIGRETGQISGNILEARKGFWTLEKDVKLNLGDVVFYWVYLAIGQDEDRVKGHQPIYNLLDPSCKPSPTTVNGRTVCAGELIFEDNFNTFNTSVWKHSIQFSDEIDQDFSIYTDNPENSFVEDGTLHLRATVLADSEELSRPTKLEKCTWDRPDVRYCERKPIGWDILPPTRSAMLTTKGTFSFRYGRVEIRAKTAAGDWLMSRLILDPKIRSYGDELYESGRMELLRSRGNPDVIEPSGWVLGARLNDPQAIIRTCGRNFYIYKNCHLKVNKLYSDEMHIFAVTWTPVSITFTVDGECAHVIKPPEGGFLRHEKFRDKCRESPWERGTFMTPFDKEFYVHIGLVVAGFNNYHGGAVSMGHKKPWNDRNPRAMLQFWQNRNIWLPTWKSDMEVDYVKIWAL